MNNKIGKKKRKLIAEAASAASTVNDEKSEAQAGLDPSGDRRIFKYVSSQYIESVFSSPELVTLKCSLPKDFNDPYELFLTIDFDEDPGALAFYADVVGDLDQLPTTCFSQSPDVIPMWAHYAENHKGFAIEFSEACLADMFSGSGFQDVSYTDTPSDGLTDMLYRAFKIGKHRYHYLLRLGVYNAAYFTKATCWSYERERRMVASTSELRSDSELLLLDAPSHCVRSIIVGSRASNETKKHLLKISEELKCKYFEIRIGKSSANPYFIDAASSPHIFDGSNLIPAASHCEACLEPIPPKGSRIQCSWCQIDDQMKQYAASRNSFRMLDHAGLLDSYVEGMDKITMGSPKSDRGEP
ncbi:DUF2971 domain-containing protein [Tardiphaga sp. 11_C7_N12_6]|uniref:DUF2971 domain-containing protein n=1 Tax=Tardiphaga sp. 11_C7_N12_6 TaxID=3240789 RepID=UPI003F241BE4